MARSPHNRHLLPYHGAPLAKGMSLMRQKDGEAFSLPDRLPSTLALPHTPDTSRGKQKTRGRVKREKDRARPS